MSALVALLLAAADLTPPPAVEVDAASEAEAPPAPEWNMGPQVAVSFVQTLNGLFLGVAACGATPCYQAGPLPPTLFGALGAGAGLTASLLDRDVGRDWGRALMVDSLTLGAAFAGMTLATRPQLALGQTNGYTVIFLTDAALTAGAFVLARHVSPRLETVLLADSLGLWGIALGASAANFVRGSDPALFMTGGALAGAVAGAMMGFSAQRMTIWRVLLANAAAMAGALVLGGGLSFYEASISRQHPYDPTVPAAGAAAGIAGGFLVAFALSESL